VLHHLQPEDSSDFDNVGLCLREIYRVLKPKGAVIINTCTPEQCIAGYWFLQLNSELLLDQDKYRSLSVIETPLICPSSHQVCMLDEHVHKVHMVPYLF